MRQDPAIDFTEPCLSFRHMHTRGDEITIRVGFSHGMAPPWTDYLEFFIDFATPRSELIDAAASLQSQLRRYRALPGAHADPPQAPRPLLPSFIIDWDLEAPGETSEGAERLVRAFAEWIHLEPEIVWVDPVPGKDCLWYIRFTTPVLASTREYGEAVLQMLRHLPTPFGAPRIAGAHIATDGGFLSFGEIDPVPQPPWPQRSDPVEAHEPTHGDAGTTTQDEDAESVEVDQGDFAKLRGYFALTNYAGGHPFPRHRHSSASGTGEQAL